MLANARATELLDLHARLLTEVGPEAAGALASAVTHDLADLMAVASQAFRALSVTPAPPRLQHELERALGNVAPAPVPGARRRTVRRRRLAIVTGGAALALAGVTAAWLAERLWPDPPVPHIAAPAPDG